MFESIIAFFSHAPPAFDPVFIPWLTALIAGNVIIVSAVWAVLKYLAKVTPWAGDDKIIQIITGAIAAAKGVVTSKPKEECVEHVPDGNGKCEVCGHELE